MARASRSLSPTRRRRFILTLGRASTTCWRLPHHHHGGVGSVERALGCPNLFDADQIGLYAAIQDALHAYALLRRDVDYVLHDNAVVTIDEFKGRIVRERRWPAGLHTALELKEQVSPKPQGRILGSVTLEHLAGLYPALCGMTGTAATQAEEFQSVYGLGVTVIPPNRPVVRTDHPDRCFQRKAEKERAVADEIRRVHATGRPVLVGTASVEESERLSRQIRDLPHAVLNARHEESEATIIARAGDRAAVTISTNMAGRGVDIALGPGVVALGGLCVLGMNRHESRPSCGGGRAGRGTPAVPSSSCRVKMP